MRISESRLRSIIRSVIKESQSNNGDSDWQDVWEELEWKNYNIDYSDDGWDHVQELFEKLTSLNINDYRDRDEDDYHYDWEECRKMFERAAESWFNSGSGDDRRRALEDFKRGIRRS